MAEISGSSAVTASSNSGGDNTISRSGSKQITVEFRYTSILENYWNMRNMV